MTPDSAGHRLAAVTIDETSLAPGSLEAGHERKVAIADLLEANSFEPTAASGGPYELHLACVEGRLTLEITGPHDAPRRHVLSMTPLKAIIKDYLLICDSYEQALRNATPSQIEAIDMGRRGLHDEGAEKLRGRLEGKISMDGPTARRLFTLICALYWRP